MISCIVSLGNFATGDSDGRRLKKYRTAKVLRTRCWADPTHPAESSPTSRSRKNIREVNSGCPKELAQVNGESFPKEGS